MLSARENGGGASYSIVVIRRILDVLGEAGGMKKTNLAGKTGLNYPNCVRYIELLRTLGWVRIADDGTNNIYLTEQGAHFRSILSPMATTGGNISGSDTPETVAKEASKDPELQSKKSLYNIMLVDDEPDVLLTYKVYLTKQGYNVNAFPDAKNALQEMASRSSLYYDLIITDIRMKSLNGLQLYQGIRSIDANAKVIFVSALDAIEELVSVLPDIKRKHIIRKPVQERVFIDTVKEALRDGPAGSAMVTAPVN